MDPFNKNAVISPKSAYTGNSQKKSNVSDKKKSLAPNAEWEEEGKLEFTPRDKLRSSKMDRSET
jgi:hypothetical protein